MDWFSQIDIYCERTDFSYWSEPLNALTNFFYLAGAIWAWWRNPEPEVRINRVLAVLLGLIAIGSYLFHTHATVWASTADVVPIALFILVYLFAVNRDVIGMRWWLALGATLLFHSLCGPPDTRARPRAVPRDLEFLLDGAASDRGLRPPSSARRHPATARGMLIGCRDPLGLDYPALARSHPVRRVPGRHPYLLAHVQRDHAAVDDRGLPAAPVAGGEGTARGAAPAASRLPPGYLVQDDAFGTVPLKPGLREAKAPSGSLARRRSCRSTSKRRGKWRSWRGSPCRRRTFRPSRASSTPFSASSNSWGEVDVEGVEPMVSVTPMHLKRREDVVTDGGQAGKVRGTPRRAGARCARRRGGGGRGAGRPPGGTPPPEEAGGGRGRGADAESETRTPPGPTPSGGGRGRGGGGGGPPRPTGGGPPGIRRGGGTRRLRSQDPRPRPRPGHGGRCAAEGGRGPPTSAAFPSASRTSFCTKGVPSQAAKRHSRRLPARVRIDRHRAALRRRCRHARQAQHGRVRHGLVE